MIIDINKNTNTLLLTVQGKVDGNTVYILKKVINENQSRFTCIEINMKKLEYISEDGIQELCEINNESEGKLDFKIANMSDELRNTFENAGFSRKQLV